MGEYRKIKAVESTCHSSQLQRTHPRLADWSTCVTKLIELEWLPRLQTKWAIYNWGAICTTFSKHERILEFVQVNVSNEYKRLIWVYSLFCPCIIIPPSNAIVNTASNSIYIPLIQDGVLQFFLWTSLIIWPML